MKFEQMYKDAFMADLQHSVETWKEDVSPEMGLAFCLETYEECFEDMKDRFETISGLIDDEVELIDEMEEALKKANRSMRAYIRRKCAA